jgi:hypothetical protein
MFDIMCLEGLLACCDLWVEAILIKGPHDISGRTWRTRCNNQSWVVICMSGKYARSPVAVQSYILTSFSADVLAQASVQVPLPHSRGVD